MKEWLMELCEGMVGWQADMIVEHVQKMVADEREACAKVCEQYENDMGYGQPQKCADAIRARGRA